MTHQDPYQPQPVAQPQPVPPQYPMPQRYQVPQQYQVPPQHPGAPAFGAGPGAPQPPRPKSRTWVWVLAVVLTLLVLCGGGAVAVIYWAYNVSKQAGPLAAPGATPFTPAPPGRRAPRPEPTPVPSASTVPAGRTVTVTGAKGERFQVTVRTRKLRKTPCDAYSSKPESGGYLVADITMKVLNGRPDVSPFSFKFRAPDGTELDMATGSGCEDFSEIVHPMKVGRAGTATMAFDVAQARGELVLLWPIFDDAAAWQVG